MHEGRSRWSTVAPDIVLALITSFLIVTVVSPFLRWVLAPNADALIALSVLAAFPCFALLAFGLSQIRQVVAERADPDAGGER